MGKHTAAVWPSFAGGYENAIFFLCKNTQRQLNRYSRDKELAYAL